MRITRVSIGTREWKQWNATMEAVTFPLQVLARDTTPLLQQMVVHFAAA